MGARGQAEGWGPGQDGGSGKGEGAAQMTTSEALLKRARTIEPCLEYASLPSKSSRPSSCPTFQPRSQQAPRLSLLP
eukprot:5680264-Pleurochrysis_carterae.AAC.1